jgi:hypothetical protein
MTKHQVYSRVIGPPGQSVIERANVFELPTGRALVHMRDPVDGSIRETLAFRDKGQALDMISGWYHGTANWPDDGN